MLGVQTRSQNDLHSSSMDRFARFCRIICSRRCDHACSAHEHVYGLGPPQIRHFRACSREVFSSSQVRPSIAFNLLNSFAKSKPERIHFLSICKIKVKPCRLFRAIFLLFPRTAPRKSLLALCELRKHRNIVSNPDVCEPKRCFRRRKVAKLLGAVFVRPSPPYRP